MVYQEESVLSPAGSRDLILIPLPGMEGRSGVDVETAVSALAGSYSCGALGALQAGSGHFRGQGPLLGISKGGCPVC